MYFGTRLDQSLHGGAGDYMYVPAEMPHLVLNRSPNICRAVVAHVASHDQMGIVLLPNSTNGYAEKLTPMIRVGCGLDSDL